MHFLKQNNRYIVPQKMIVYFCVCQVKANIYCLQTFLEEQKEVTKSEAPSKIKAVIWVKFHYTASYILPIMYLLFLIYILLC